jgi:hypothetical protein
MCRSDHLTSVARTKSAHKEWKFYMVRLRFGRRRPDLAGEDKVTGSLSPGFEDGPENRSHPPGSSCAQLRVRNYETGVSDRVHEDEKPSRDETLIGPPVNYSGAAEEPLLSSPGARGLKLLANQAVRAGVLREVSSSPARTSSERRIVSVGLQFDEVVIHRSHLSMPWPGMSRRIRRTPSLPDVGNGRGVAVVLG